MGVSLRAGELGASLGRRSGQPVDDFLHEVEAIAQRPPELIFHEKELRDVTRNDLFMALAWARGFSEASPVRSLIVGGGTQTLDVEVRIFAA